MTTVLSILPLVVGTGGVFNFSAQDHNGLGLDAFEDVRSSDAAGARVRTIRDSRGETLEIGIAEGTVLLPPPAGSSAQALWWGGAEGAEGEEGATPSIEKRLADTHCPWICSGSAPPDKTKFQMGEAAAISLNDWFCCLKSLKSKNECGCCGLFSRAFVLHSSAKRSD